MMSPLLLMAWILGSYLLASACIVEHSFHVKDYMIERLCERRMITTVNGSLPGPLLRVNEGDDVIIHVFNDSPYNISIHWHGLFHKLTPWSDGPAYITQCPIQPGKTYIYRYNVAEQEGTLWWHAHINWLRATVYGGLIIYPRKGRTYPFPKPAKEFPIIIGEWWNANVIDVERESIATGAAPNLSNAYTINGQPGHRYPCSKDKMTRFEVVQGKTYLLRIINAAVNNQHFFKVAKHTFTVVAIDAMYTVPYKTDVIMSGPGQTVDALMTANQPVGSYYAAAEPYISAMGIPFDNTITTAIFTYKNSDCSTPIMPELPPFDDTSTAHKFYSNLTGLTSAPFWKSPILDVDEHMFMTVGLGLVSCGRSHKNCLGLFNQSFAATINNFSFELPTTSILEAQYFKLPDVYNATFPKEPEVPFGYTNLNTSLDLNLLMTKKSTTVKRLKYNTTVEIVFQNTALIGIENHPMHIHCFNFQVLAQGFGNFDPNVHRKLFNLHNPQVRNTIAVPTGGWAVVRFLANNPGAWLLHCHLDVHLTWGLATVFVIEEGGTPESAIPPPPDDLPKC